MIEPRPDCEHSPLIELTELQDHERTWFCPACGALWIDSGPKEENE